MLPGDLSHPAASPAAGLPALPDANAPTRHTSSAVYAELLEADLYASEGVTKDEFGWNFSDEGASWAIFAVDAQTQTPQRLDVPGYFFDLWIAVADYDRGGWRFLRGNAWSCGPVVELTEGGVLPAGYVSPGGVLYLLLYSPQGYAFEPSGYGGGAEALRVALADGEGDTAPPQWPDPEHIAEVVPDEFGATVTWDDATDPSGLAYYLLYFAPADLGIDPSSPYVWLPPDATEFYLDSPDEGYAHSVTLRAVDTAGNLTPLAAPAEFTMPDTAEPDQLLCEVFPGDRVQVTWSDPTIDMGLFLTAPNLDEGDPEMPEYLGRSFILGPDSADSGLAEEWVRIAPTPPAGVYELAIAVRFANETTYETLHVAVYDKTGALRRDLGDYELGGYLATMQWMAKLYVSWPE